MFAGRSPDKIVATDGAVHEEDAEASAKLVAVRAKAANAGMRSLPSGAFPVASRRKVSMHTSTMPGTPVRATGSPFVPPHDAATIASAAAHAARARMRRDPTEARAIASKEYRKSSAEARESVRTAGIGSPTYFAGAEAGTGACGTPFETRRGSGFSGKSRRLPAFARTHASTPASSWMSVPASALNVS